MNRAERIASWLRCATLASLAEGACHCLVPVSQAVDLGIECHPEPRHRTPQSAPVKENHR